MWRALVLPCFLLALALAVSCGGQVAPLSLQDEAQRPAGIETVRRAFDRLFDGYVRPLQSNDLLGAAWSGVAQEAARGGAAPPRAPALVGRRAADWPAFAQAFRRATSHADAGPYAFAAVDAMAKSLHDDHVFFLSPQQARAQRQQRQGSTPTGLFSTGMLAGGFGYLRLRSFPAPYAPVMGPGSKNLGAALDEALADFERQGVGGWVLDLRNNSGGAIASISTLTGRFIPDGVVQSATSRCGSPGETLVDGHFFTPQRPLAVLINRISASAAEMTAATLREYGAARLFGEKTAGAVAAALVQELSGGASLEYTIQTVRTGVAAAVLDGAGVQPDETVAATPGGADTQLQAAVRWLRQPGAGAATRRGAPAPAGNALPAAALHDLLAPYLLRLSDLPPSAQDHAIGEQIYDTPNEYASGGVNATAQARRIAGEGWLGHIVQTFGSDERVDYSLSIGAYKDGSSLDRALEDAYHPPRAPAPKLDAQARRTRAAACQPRPRAQRSHRVALPVSLGSQTRATEGPGFTQLSWREGRLTFTLAASFAPGHERFDDLVRVARALDARYHQNPLP